MARSDVVRRVGEAKPEAGTAGNCAWCDSLEGFRIRSSTLSEN